MYQIMLGTKYLHEENILERNLNPYNILIIEIVPGVIVFKICGLGVYEVVNPIFKQTIKKKLTNNYLEEYNPTQESTPYWTDSLTLGKFFH